MLSEKPWKLDAVMMLLMSLLLSISLVMCVSVIVLHQHGAKPDDNSPAAVIFSTLALHGSILVAAFVFLRFQRLKWADAFGFKTPRLGVALMWGLILGICFTPVGQAMNALIAYAFESIHVQAQNEQAVETLRKAEPGFLRVYLVFFAVVLAPFAEETLFRGILYPTIKQYGFPRAALWGTSFLFALIHFNLSAFLPLMLFAILLALLYEKTNNLLACMVAHSIFNLAGVILLYHYSSGSDHPPY